MHPKSQRTQSLNPLEPLFINEWNGPQHLPIIAERQGRHGRWWHPLRELSVISAVGVLPDGTQVLHLSVVHGHPPQRATDDEVQYVLNAFFAPIMDESTAGQKPGDVARHFFWRTSK